MHGLVSNVHDVPIWATMKGSHNEFICILKVKHNPLARPNCAMNPERTDYGPSGPTPTSATIVHHHLPTQLNRSAALRSLH
ncbi:MAG: hypothetical protein OKBPIBMD_00253 [Chlorobi bacterium]|nr:hypothetical protein [Chlorobiota bacterium]